MHNGRVLVACTLLLSCIVVTVFVDRRSAEVPEYNEPEIGAAHGHHNNNHHSNWHGNNGHHNNNHHSNWHGNNGHHNNSSIATAPVHFGALVGSDNPVYVDLGTDGSRVTNTPGEHSYIGDFNTGKFSGSARYLIKPGRLKFNVSVASKYKYLLVKFPTNTDVPGVTFSGLNVETTDTDNVALITNHNVPNELKFEVLHGTCNFYNPCWFGRRTTYVTVDLALYGRLNLASHITGDVYAELETTISKLR